ncbi:MAG TPA: hypothetical protein VGF96_09440 [Terracidiphilus sp.]|jgi:hypothetical protein
MLVRRHLWLALLLTTLPMWSQVAPSATGDENTSDGDTQMSIPPPVSDASYPTEVADEARSNYMRVGVAFQTAYIDNLYAGNGATAIGETTYSIFPTISIDQTTTRQHRMFTYSPGFTFYQPTTGLNETDQNGMADFTYRVTQHLAATIHDTFIRSSTAYGLSDFATGGAISGSPSLLPPGIIAPFAERLTNTTTGQVSYQFSEAGMVGASGTFMMLRYPNQAEASGLYNSDERGASAFLNRRISARQYVGMNYQFSRSLTYPANATSVTQTQTVYGFYTIYPKRNLSLSISGGPQHYGISQTSQPNSGGWGPLVMASVGWQGLRTSIAGSYSREVTGGGGLLGAFVSTSAEGSGRWQLSRRWTAGVSASYAINKPVGSVLDFASEEGHSISGFATVQHPLSSRIGLEFEYDRLHQSYSGITVVSSNPNSNREKISLNWEFSRPLGR